MIFRIVKDKENPYVILNKQFLNDARLTAKAKGILSYLLSLPDDWQIYEEEITKHFADGIKSIRSGIKELIKYKYISREQKRKEKGQFSSYEYHVYEVSTEMPLGENGKTDIRESKSTNNNLTNNDLTEYKKEKGILSDDKSSLPVSFQNQDVIKAMKTYMNDLYRQKTKKKHPFLKPEQYRSVYNQITSFCEEWGTEYDSLIDMMVQFLNTKTIQSDWNINHFATEGMMLNRMYEVAY